MTSKYSCPKCGKKFDSYQARNGHMSGAHTENSGQFQKGHKPWNKGKTKEDDDRIRKYGESVSKTLEGRTLSESHKLAIEESCQGINRGKDNGMFGETHSPEIRAIISEKIGGENHYRWNPRGRVYPPEFNEELREKVKERDGGKCVSCGSTENLVVHHIWSKGENDLEDLTTLCASCHIRLHNRISKHRKKRGRDRPDIHFVGWQSMQEE